MIIGGKYFSIGFFHKAVKNQYVAIKFYVGGKVWGLAVIKKQIENQDRECKTE